MMGQRWNRRALVLWGPLGVMTAWALVMLLWVAMVQVSVSNSGVMPGGGSVENWYDWSFAVIAYCAAYIVVMLGIMVVLIAAGVAALRSRGGNVGTIMYVVGTVLLLGDYLGKIVPTHVYESTTYTFPVAPVGYLLTIGTALIWRRSERTSEPAEPNEADVVTNAEPW